MVTIDLTHPGSVRVATTDEYVRQLETALGTNRRMKNFFLKYGISVCSLDSTIAY